MTQEQIKFFASFESKTGQKVKTVELAELRCTTESYSKLSLKLTNFQSSLWGLLVFCENDIFFYVSPHESYISFFMRKSSGEDEPEEQCINLSEKKIKWSIYPEKWYSFMTGEKNRTVIGKFTEDKEYSIYFILNKKASGIFQMLNNFNNATK